jgi:hypothetical protein
VRRGGGGHAFSFSFFVSTGIPFVVYTQGKFFVCVQLTYFAGTPTPRGMSIFSYKKKGTRKNTKNGKRRGFKNNDFEVRAVSRRKTKPLAAPFV